MEIESFLIGFLLCLVIVGFGKKIYEFLSGFLKGLWNRGEL